MRRGARSIAVRVLCAELDLKRSPPPLSDRTPSPITDVDPLAAHPLNAFSPGTAAGRRCWSARRRRLRAAGTSRRPNAGHAAASAPGRPTSGALLDQETGEVVVAQNADHLFDPGLTMKTYAVSTALRLYVTRAFRWTLGTADSVSDRPARIGIGLGGGGRKGRVGVDR